MSQQPQPQPQASVPAPSKSHQLERVTRAIRFAVTKSPGLAGLLLWVPYAVTDEEAIAYTNGTKMYFCKGFFNLSDKEQVGVVVHEVMHVAFRHIQRSKRVRATDPDYSNELFNIAGDVLINHAIKGVSWLDLPQGTITPSTVFDYGVLEKKPIEQWNVEQVYGYLKKNKKGQKAKLLMPDLQPGKGEGSGDPQKGDGDGDSVSRGQIVDDELQDRIWSDRLNRAMAGEGTNGILRKIGGDIPKNTIPWEKVLRDFVSARVMPTTETSWNRPSRRSLVFGKKLGYLEPGLERQRGVRRCGVIVDTSGSISGKIIDTFFAEINGIQSKTGCEIVMVVSDCAVHTVTFHREAVRPDFHFKGGGGTDFRPGIKEMEKYDVDCCVYLTDLMGSFPDKKPSFPLLWATIMDADIPFGRKVQVPFDGY